MKVSGYIEADEPVRVREDGLNITLCIRRGVVPDYIHMTRCQAEALRAQLNRIFNPEAMTLLDHAARRVDALGGPNTPDEYDSALIDVQEVLETLGATLSALSVQPMEKAA